MAQAAASPELTPRQTSRNLPSVAATNERSDLSEEVVKALETYKKKDSPKGAFRLLSLVFIANLSIQWSCVSKVLEMRRL